MSDPTTQSGKRIVFTGGSGKAGRHVIPYLVAKGHKVLNLDLLPFPDPSAGVYTLKTDLTDSGQVFNALTSHFHMNGYLAGPVPGPPDVVIHFAAYARNMLVPDSELFQANVRATYNVVEAASKLGVKKIIIASSETVYGVCFAQGDAQYHSFPLEEDYDVDPEDSYALSKVCGEKTARTFARRFKSDIYALRIGNVIEPHEYARDFPAFIADPPSRKRNAWSYIDARDLGQICDLAIEKSGEMLLSFLSRELEQNNIQNLKQQLTRILGLGFQVFNATNDTITIKDDLTTKEFLEKECPGTKFTREMGAKEAPMSNRKIREVLGYKDVHDWRNYL
ncbi:dTDP-D-glucose 4,6-dehydratase [Lachnellula occidentalis]|uniref:dTDP-D-glucose 4,6-dehydratase n=1 Tax=Lachnellula occidentalis TaxID=215460 RepID=A0A8H8UBZ2_9HELO|nr:dTDP-D-glucose 4,6-dehydratase [Lachnellula occidentalis]